MDPVPAWLPVLLEGPVVLELPCEPWLLPLLVVGVVDDWPALPCVPPVEPLLPPEPLPVCALKPSARNSADATSHVIFIVVLLIAGIVAFFRMTSRLREGHANKRQLAILGSWASDMLASQTLLFFAELYGRLGLDVFHGFQ